MNLPGTQYYLEFADFEIHLLNILFYSIPGMILLWQGVQGWRHGFKRKLASLFSISAALVAAYYGGEYVHGLLPKEEPTHPFARDLAATGLAGLGCYLVLRLLITAVLFRGKEEPSSTDRAAGLLSGLTVASLWILAWGLTIRHLGAFLETALYAETPEGAVPQETMEKQAPRQNLPVRAFLFWNQKSREAGADALLQKADPLPPAFTVTSRNLLLLSRKPAALSSILAQPATQTFLRDDPDVRKLAQNPEVLRAVQHKRWGELLKHPQVYRVLRSPAFLERLRQSGIQEAITAALNES